MSSKKPHHITPRITLIGAGPGDPELLTVKGLRLLQTADVVLYDALVSEKILALIPGHVHAWSVGKRAGDHSFRQEEINTLIVDFANRYGHVVRLKGGDPFVFGRGQEEIDYALSRGIEVNVVPGVSSAFAVPASIGIPLTCRGVSESFWVVTGTTRSGGLSADIALAAQSTATVVILMGMQKLDEIMQLFAAAGKPQTPVAVIQNGTLPGQKSVTGTVSTIASDVARANLGAPAVIVVGEVVKLTTAGDLRELLRSQGISAAH